MVLDELEFSARKGKIIIDYSRCEAVQKNTSEPSCGFACVKACRLYGRSILKIHENRPVLAVSDPVEIERLDNECLGCEFDCWLYGKNCIRIELPLSGLDECRQELGWR